MSYALNAYPIGSSHLWQPAQSGLVVCASIASCVVWSVPTGTLRSTPGGGAGMRSQSSCSRTALPRSTCDGDCGCALTARNAARVRMPRRLSGSGVAVKSVAGADAPYSDARSRLTYDVLDVSSWLKLVAGFATAFSNTSVI